MSSVVADPWAPERPAPPRRSRWASAAPVGAWVLGGAWPIAVLWSQGDQQRRAALLLAAGLAVWELVLARGRAGRPSRIAALVAVATATELLTRPDVGRAPAIVGLAAVTAAHAALVGWRPGGPGEQQRAAVVAPAALLVAASGVTWYRLQAVALAIALDAAAVAVVAWHERSPHADRVDRAVARLVKGTGTAVASVVLLVVAVPLVYLPGALVRALHWVVGATRGQSTTWADAGAASGRRVRDVGVPFASPPPATTRRRHLIGALVVTALAAGTVVEWRRTEAAPSAPARGSGAASATTTVPTDPQPTDRSIADRLDDVPYHDRPALAGQPHADALQAETRRLRLVPDPVVGFVPADFHGRYISVVDGVRSTVASSCHGCPTVRLWLAGGSLVFGVGQRDGHTIASELVRAASADGIRLDVTNLGVPGWTLDQEQRGVGARLDAGGSAQLVVFLDGFNDTIAVLQDLLSDGRLPDGPIRLDPRGVDALLASGGAFPTFSPAAYGAQAADRYREVATPFDRRVRAAGAVPLRYFQPDASATTVQRSAVESLGVLPPGFYQRSRFDAVLAAAAAGLTGTATDLRDAFDQVDQPVFLDTAHVSEAGARLLAQRLYRELRPTVRSLAR